MVYIRKGILPFFVICFMTICSPVLAINETACMAPDTIQKSDSIYVLVDKQAEFPGGQQAMYQFIMNNIQYPQKAQEEGVSGTVFVRFVVNTEGSITNVELQKKLSKECDEEALRVIKLMPKWNPAVYQHKPVSVYFTLPIRYKLIE